MSEHVRVNVRGDGVYSCGLTQLEQTAALVHYLTVRAVKNIYCVALLRDLALEKLAAEAGIGYTHAPLRAGVSPASVRTAVGHAQRLRKAGPILLVGETDASGAVSRIARVIAEGR